MQVENEQLRARIRELAELIKQKNARLKAHRRAHLALRGGISLLIDLCEDEDMRANLEQLLDGDQVYGQMFGSWG